MRKSTKKVVPAKASVTSAPSRASRGRGRGDAKLDMGGLPCRNLMVMRALAAAYPNAQMVKQLVSLLPWGHIVRLLQRIKYDILSELVDMNRGAVELAAGILANFKELRT